MAEIRGTNKAQTRPRVRARVKGGPGRGKKPGTREAVGRPKTRAQQGAFLEQYAAIGVITAAAKLVGISRMKHYEWLADPKKYPDYRRRFNDAAEQAADRAEQEMVRRGIVGWEEPVFGKLPGKDEGSGIIGKKRMFSDRMLELCLKARRPEKFRERTSTEVTGKGGGPVESRVQFYLPKNGRERDG